MKYVNILRIFFLLHFCVHCSAQQKTNSVHFKLPLPVKATVSIRAQTKPISICVRETYFRKREKPLLKQAADSLKKLIFDIDPPYQEHEVEVHSSAHVHQGSTYFPYEWHFDEETNTFTITTVYDTDYSITVPSDVHINVETKGEINFSSPYAHVTMCGSNIIISRTNPKKKNRFEAITVPIETTEVISNLTYPGYDPPIVRLCSPEKFIIVNEILEKE